MIPKNGKGTIKLHVPHFTFSFMALHHSYLISLALLTPAGFNSGWKGRWAPGSWVAPRQTQGISVYLVRRLLTGLTHRLREEVMGENGNRSPLRSLVSKTDRSTVPNIPPMVRASVTPGYPNNLKVRSEPGSHVARVYKTLAVFPS